MITKEITKIELYQFVYREICRAGTKDGFMPYKEWLSFRRRFTYFWNKLKFVKRGDIDG